MSAGGGERVDLRELALQAAREEALSKRTDALQLVTFGRNADPERTDPVGRHPSNGRLVFPDKKRLGAAIKVGETYFCDLAEYHPAAGQPVYNANPIVKIDAAYLSDLRSDQLGRIVELLRKSDLDSLIEAAEARIRRGMEPKVQAESEDAKLSVPPGVRAPVDTSDAPSLTRTAGVALAEEIPREKSERTGFQRLEQAEATEIDILRTSGNCLQAPQFADGLFQVFVSPDRHHLLAAPSSSGPFRATGGLLRLPELAMLRPFNLPERLPGLHDPCTGNVSIRI